MVIQTISPERAQELLKTHDAILVDIREPDEFARERISGACNRPLAAIGASSLSAHGAKSMIFCCRSGIRTAANGAKLAEAAGCTAYVLEGGMDAWKRARLPVLTDLKQPMEIMRQVQIVAGGIVVAGVVLGATLQPAFYFLAAFIGAGLVLAGVTGTCALARLLRIMPWNRTK